MNRDLAQEAISKALSGDWKEAVSLNKKILSGKPKDTAALNRLARAYAELGNYPSAKNHAKKVLKIDPFNQIANKALEKWSGLKKGDTGASKGVAKEAFIEEPGKTKITPLLHLGSETTVASLDAGDEVEISTSNHRVSINTLDGKYIGRLSDDLSARLRKLIKHGNKYEAFIKSSNKDDVKVFLKEKERAAELSDVASFSGDKIDYVSFTPPELIHKRDSVSEEVESDSEEEI